MQSNSQSTVHDTTHRTRDYGLSAAAGCYWVHKTSVTWVWRVWHVS